MKWRGVVSDGQGYNSTLGWEMGYYPGSLNLKPIDKPLKLKGNATGSNWMPVQAYGEVEGIPVLIGLGNGDITEIKAKTHLRSDLKLENGDIVEVIVKNEG